MGVKGPIPARSDQRVRRNLPDTPIDKITAIGPVDIPDLDMPDAHQLVKDLYESMKVSAQSRYYEGTDWNYARIAFVFLDDLLKNPSRRGASMMLSSIIQMMTPLLLTEGDRRRVRLEVERSQEGAKVLDIAEMFRKKLEQG